MPLGSGARGARQDIDPGLCVHRQHRARCRGRERRPGTVPIAGDTSGGVTAVLTCGVRGPGRSPLPWRSGDSDALPAGDSPPERGERLRSTTGTAAGKRPSRGSTSLECPRSPGDGEAGTARRPPRLPPRPSPAGGVSGRWGARGRGPEGPRFSRAARSLEMLSLRSRGSSRECMVPGWALRGTPRGHCRGGGHQCHPEHRPSPAPWQCPLCSGLEDTVLARRPCRPFRPPCRGPLPQRAKGRAWHRPPHPPAPALRCPQCVLSVSLAQPLGP